MLSNDWLPAAFSKILQKRREFLRMSQEDVSRRSGLHRTYISDVERGARNVSLRNMSKLAAALDIEPSLLIRWAEIHTQPERISRHTEAEMGKVFDASNIGYHVLDLSGRILTINSLQLAWLDRSQEGTVGILRYEEVVADHSLDAYQSAIFSVKAGAATQPVRIDLVKRDGSPVPVSITLSAVTDESGQTVMVRALVQSHLTQATSSAANADALADGLYKAIVDYSEDAIIATSLDGTILAWNKGAERLYGYAAGEAIGRSIQIVLPSGDTDELRQIIHRTQRGYRIEQMEEVRLRKDGTPVQVSLSVAPVRNAAGDVIGSSAISRDITERKEREFQEQAQLALTQALENHADVSMAIPEILKAVCSYTRWDLGILWTVDKSKNHLFPYAVHGNTERSLRAAHVMSDDYRYVIGCSMPGNVWQTGEPAWAEDLSAQPYFLRQEHAAHYDLKSAMWFPLSVGREVIGVFEFMSQQTKPMDHELILLMVTLGKRIGRYLSGSGQELPFSEPAKS